MKQLLVIGHVWPEPKTTAAGNRMMQLLEAFFFHNFEITFSSTAIKTKHSEDLNKFEINEVGIQLNDSSFDEFILQLKPDIIIFDRFMVEEQFGWRVAENSPNSIRILNTEDLHSLRESRQFCFKKGEEWTHTNWLLQDKTKRELASIYRSDLTLLVSDFEAKLLEKTVGIPKSLLLYLPFLLKEITEAKTSEWSGFEERTDFISFGNGKHAPNVDSFTFLKSEIWPLIRKELPKANLHLFGAYLPQQILKMHDPQTGFLIKGWVEKLDTEIQNSRIVLAPLRFGAGIKGKLTQAMQNGTPSITTKIGAEGMHDDLNWGGIICDNQEEIVQSAIDLYCNSDKWKSAQNNGISIINTLFDEKENRTKLFAKLDTIRKNLFEHRSKNVVGGLLQHQSMAATKFMSKWIEEKNK